MLSPQPDYTNAAILIGTIVTAAITNRPTMLQVDLGILMNEK